jgi:hypothetical protein
MQVGLGSCALGTWAKCFSPNRVSVYIPLLGISPPSATYTSFCSRAGEQRNSCCCRLLPLQMPRSICGPVLLASQKLVRGKSLAPILTSVRAPSPKHHQIWCLKQTSAAGSLPSSTVGSLTEAATANRRFTPPAPRDYEDELLILIVLFLHHPALLYYYCCSSTLGQIQEFWTRTKTNYTAYTFYVAWHLGRTTMVVFGWTYRGEWDGLSWMDR